MTESLGLPARSADASRALVVDDDQQVRRTLCRVLKAIGISPAEAMVELQRCAGLQFDPDVVAAFQRAFPDVSKLPIEIS